MKTNASEIKGSDEDEVIILVGVTVPNGKTIKDSDTSGIKVWDSSLCKEH